MPLLLPSILPSLSFFSDGEDLMNVLRPKFGYDEKEELIRFKAPPRHNPHFLTS